MSIANKKYSDHNQTNHLAIPLEVTIDELRHVYLPILTLVGPYNSVIADIPLPVANVPITVLMELVLYMDGTEYWLLHDAIRHSDPISAPKSLA